MASMYGFDPHELTFNRLLAAKAAKNGDKIFLTYLDDGRQFTFRDIDLLSNRIANGLIAQGLGKGSHVGVLMENSPEQILTYCALGKIGAVTVPLNPAAKGAFLEYYLTQSDCVAIVADELLLEHFTQIADAVPGVNAIIVNTDAGASAASPPAIPASCRSSSLQSLLEAPDTPIAIETRFTDLAFIMYTSGTTGPSKGNMFTQAHTLTFGMGMRRRNGIRSDDIYYVCLPLFHAGAWNTFVLSSLLDDGAVALVRRFSTSRLWSDIRRCGATVATLIAVAHFLMAQPESPEDRDHKLRLLTMGPLPDDVEAFKARFGVEMATAFGISDYCNVFGLPPEDIARKPGSCGFPLEGVKVRIVDDDDLDLPPGETGELVIRQDIPWASSSGYYRMPEKTLEAWRNQWFHTGDRGFVDEEGYFWFRDRKKDALRRRGENISASEVEAAINRHPAIAECAVYGVQAEGSDDEVAVSVVLHDGANLAHVDLVEFCGRLLPHFAVPRFVEFIAELPRTPTQKVQKALVRERVQENLKDAWDREAHGMFFKRKTRA